MAKIAVALSGGVDSALTALLLKNSGHDVTAVTLKVQNDLDGQSVCAGDQALMKAADTAKFLGIEHHVCNVSAGFKDLILKYAWNEYANARTPSPCVRCNEKIKFGLLFDFACSLGCEFLATGHYARIVDYAGIKRVARGVDTRKDQSYFLSGIKNEILSHVMFPLGEFEKTTVRKLADDYGLPAASEKDSQNVCITRHGETFSETLCNLFHAKPVVGHFTMNGKNLKEHQGIHLYTIGQRHGLGDLVPQKCSFVKSIGKHDVEITTDPAALESFSLDADHALWHIPNIPNKCFVQIRYRSPAVEANIYPKDNGVHVEFCSAVRAVTPGQIVAFYDQDVVVGRAVIAK